MGVEPTTWWWVRHGPTHESAFVGWRDVPADLSDKDRIARLAAYLPDRATVVSSDLTRAAATADAVAGTRQRLPNARDLREFDFGAWDGLRFDDVAARDPELSRTYWENPGSVRPPQGESWNDVAARVSRFVDDLTATVPGGHVIAVAHIGTIMTQLARAPGQSPSTTLGHSIEPLSVTRIVYDGNWRNEVINHIP